MTPSPQQAGGRKGTAVAADLVQAARRAAPAQQQRHQPLPPSAAAPAPCPDRAAGAPVEPPPGLRSGLVAEPLVPMPEPPSAVSPFVSPYASVPSCVPRISPPPVGEAWTLPDGPGCAGHARSVLGEVLAQAGAPRSVIADAKLMVSELATNAHQHAPRHGPHELWLYAADPAADGPCEVRCAVFDRYFGVGLPGYSWTSGDYGRGLSIVQELSDGRWGLLRTLSRCYPRGRGKAVWFTIPAPLRLPGLA